MTHRDDSRLSRKIEWFRKQYRGRTECIKRMHENWSRLYEADWQRAAQVLDEIAVGLDDAVSYCTLVIGAHERHYDPETGQDITAYDTIDRETGEAIRDEDPTHVRPGPPFVGEYRYLSTDSDSMTPEVIKLDGKLLAWAKRALGEAVGLQLTLHTIQSSDKYESQKQEILAEGNAYYATWLEIPANLSLEYWWYDYEPYSGYEEDRIANFAGLILAEGIAFGGGRNRLALALEENDPQNTMYKSLISQLPGAVWQAIQEEVSFVNAREMRNQATNLIAGKERKKERQSYMGDVTDDLFITKTDSFEARESAQIEMRDRLERNHHPSREEEAMFLRAEGLKYREIAERMNVSLGTVKSFIKRGRDRDKRKSVQGL